MEQLMNTILLPNGKTAAEWTRREKPCVNHWYMLKISDINPDPDTGEVEPDFWKITKDFHSPETQQTYYKIVEYYNGDIFYCGKLLSEIRDIMRDFTYRMVI